MEDFTRRDLAGIVAAGAASAALAASTAQAADAATTPLPVFAVQHQAKPLPFDAGRLRGLSEKLISSHWQNNYMGSVRALNMIRGKLAAAMADKDFPALVYGGLKREELHRTGSVILHEEYFASLGGDGMPGGDIATALAAAYGSVDNWRDEFRRTASSLGGGSGWCILVYNLNTRSLTNHWAWDHMHNATSGIPLLPMDMYEHSYHMDYGTAAAKYMDAFFDNINWQEVERRYQRALKMSQA